MRRGLVILGILALAGVLAATALLTIEDDGGPEFPRYTIEFDTAFGLVVGGDVRVAGVNAGTVKDIELDQDVDPRKEPYRALVDVEITQTGFGSFRKDAFCETRPQSPLGEFFIDCNPGTSREELPEGSKIPVRQTATTIPNDLIADVYRRPYRERFRLIMSEFGAGLAGRGDDLNEAIRRAVPAIRQTDRVLAILASHNRVIRRLVEDADRVLGRLSDNRRDVGRWVEEVRDTSAASAERRDDIATNFRNLPLYLEELEPTMASLGTLTEEQTPVLRDLNASAGQLERFFDASAEFSDASRPATRALADTARVGRRTMRSARPRIRELRQYANLSPDPARNLRIVFEDFSDPSRAVEPDPRSPGGRGFSGMQALARYIFSQSVQANAFDLNGYISRSFVFQDDCARYVDAKRAREDTARTEKCASWLGPNQIGVTVSDPTAEGASARGGSDSGSRSGGDAEGKGAPGGRTDSQGAAEVLSEALGPLGTGRSNEPRAPAPSDVAPQTILDFLLAP
jgi:phospholipid/cholesterol/gamma-HCH transport system substrate-binding protein